LQIGLRDYDPDKRFNGSVRLPHKAYNKIKVLFDLDRFVSLPMLPILKRQLPMVSPTLMLMDSKHSTKTRPRLKNGLRNMTFF
jgi:hypothetical protein